MYKGVAYLGVVASPDGVAVLRRAREAFAADTSGAAPLHHFPAATRDRLDAAFAASIEDGKSNYDQVQLASLVLVNNEFHAAMAAVLGPHGEVLHGAFKSLDSFGAKIQRQYSKLTKPECIHVKDVLRVTCFVDDHRRLEAAHAALGKSFKYVVTKNRLGEATRDVLCVIQLRNGVLAEVQFSFRAVALMKSFSHAAYAITRLETDGSASAVEDILKALFTMPILVSNFAGGYNARTPDEIQLRLAF